MSPLPEPQEPIRETTNPNLRPGWLLQQEQVTLDERTRLPLGLVVTLGVMLATGIAQAAVAFSKLSDLGNRVDKQETISVERGIQGQRTDDKLDRISEDQHEMRQDLKEMKTEMRELRGRR